MLQINDNKITSPVRQIKGKAELLSNSATSAFGKYVTFNDVIPTEKVKVKVASKNIFDLEGYSATGDKGIISNSTGTTLSTTEAINGITVTQNSYPYPDSTGNWGNGYLCILFKEQLEENQEYTVSFDMEVIANPLNLSAFLLFFNGYYGFHSNNNTTPYEVGKKYRVVAKGKYGYYLGRKYFEIRNGGMSFALSNIQIEKGSTASDYTPFIPLEGGRGSLYYNGVYGNEIGETYMGESGTYTVSEWYWYDSGELSISFEDGYYIYVSTNGLGYETPEDLLADLEIPIGTQLYYDTETDSLYRIAEGLVGSTITVGTQNLFDDNKNYGNAIIVLDENGEKVFTNADYLHPTSNYKEYVGFDISYIWDLADRLKTPLTISFDIKSPVSGSVRVYSLGSRTLNFYIGQAYANSNNTWQRYSFTAGTSFKTDASNGDLCRLSFYGTYGTGIVPFIKNLQIELGETKTPYTLHQKQEYTVDETLSVSATPYTPTTVIYPNNSGIFIEKAECKVCSCENTFSYDGDLQEITIERIGEEGKFFGFGVCQKLNVKALDTKREKNITTDNYFKIGFTTGESYVNNFPFFYVTETHRDENTNAISVTAYDVIKTMEKHTVTELGLTSYTLREFAGSCGNLFGLSLDIQGVEDFTLFDLEYPTGANFEGTETIRQALNAVAEATQTIYYVAADRLIFKQLAKIAPAAMTITKADYITLDSKDNRRLQAICATNELGDATTASISAIGTTQFVRDNPFLELREDVGDILNKAIENIGGLSINQFSCSWRGNYLLEIGDKIDLIAKDDSTVTSFVIHDTIKYNGAFSEVTKWSYTETTETPANPTTLGEALKQTFAKVDKANKQIDIVASAVNDNKEAISYLQISTDGINGAVEDIEKTLADNGDVLATLTKKVEAQITDEQVNISIQKALEDGVSRVETSTGYRLDEEGFNVSRSDSDINTTITHNGVNVSQGSKEKLVADKDGVRAEDLHATTFLIIGKNSRFESKGKRTYCYWIGG